MATERFVISQLEANFVKDQDLLGKQDPYVVFELGSEKITTPPIKSGGTACSWEESFTLIGRNSASDLQASVYNKNTLRPDSLLGMATHRILHKTEPGKLKMELTDKKGNNTGEILFILQASGGRFAQQSQGTTGSTGSGVGTGAGLGAAGAGAAGIGATSGSRSGTGTGYGTTTGTTTTGYGAGTGTGTGTGYGVGSGTGSSRGTRSEEEKNMSYEGSTASGARSGATGATGAGMGSSGVTQGVRGLNITDKSGYDSNTKVLEGNPICDTKYYTKIEDRPIVKEIKTYVREHHPVEKEFVVETRPTGQEREQTQNRTSEVVDTKERIVEVATPDPCGGVPTAQFGAGTTGTTGSSRGTTGTSGSGAGGRTIS